MKIRNEYDIFIARIGVIVGLVFLLIFLGFVFGNLQAAEPEAPWQFVTDNVYVHNGEHEIDMPQYIPMPHAAACLMTMGLMVRQSEIMGGLTSRKVRPFQQAEGDFYEWSALITYKGDVSVISFSCIRSDLTNNQPKGPIS